jgi:DNA polymerase-3 subunit gamma/tau
MTGAAPGGSGLVNAVSMRQAGGGSALRATAPVLLAPEPVPEPVAPPEVAPPAEVPQPLSLRSWREVVAYVATQREATLHGHLRHCAHLVRFNPPVIELRLEPQAPRDLSQRLARILGDASGNRWTIAVVREAGEPTLAEQAGALDADRSRSAESHPLVQAILAAFPGAKLGPVNDASLDEYGLPPEPVATELLHPDMQAPEMEFAPLDSEPVGLDDLDGEVGLPDP